MTPIGYVIVQLTEVASDGGRPAVNYFCAATDSAPVDERDRFEDADKIRDHHRKVMVFCNESDAQAHLAALSDAAKAKKYGYVPQDTAEHHVIPIYSARVVPRTAEEQAEKDERDARDAAWKAYYKAHPDQLITTSMPRQHTSPKLGLAAFAGAIGETVGNA